MELVSGYSLQHPISERMDGAYGHTTVYKTGRTLFSYIAPIALAAIVFSEATSCEHNGKKFKAPGKEVVIPAPATRDVPVQLEGIVK